MNSRLPRSEKPRAKGVVLNNMRSYIRHPFDIPIEVLPGKVETTSDKYLKNISHGGLAFNSEIELSLGTVVRIRINVVTPGLEVTGKVKWCKEAGDQFEVGLEFLDKDDEFQGRMIEQICHIEHYKNQIAANEGRDLTGQEAALEWIEKYADNFPPMDDD